MTVLRKILWCVLILALGYGVLRMVERLTVQELTRASHPTTGQAVCLIWKPRILQKNGTCDLELRNSQDKVVDTMQLGTFESGFEALQQVGQLEFQEDDVLVANRRSGEIFRRLTIRDDRFQPVN
jgi:hypothetical protein